MIIGRSSTNFMLFMPIGNPRWPPPQDIAMLIYVLRWLPSCISDRHKKQKFCRGPSNDHSWAVCFKVYVILMPIENSRWPPPQDID
jgi:hypothetical protein